MNRAVTGLVLLLVLAGCGDPPAKKPESSSYSHEFGPDWFPYPDLPAPLAEAGTATDDASLYMVGGFEATAGLVELGGTTTGYRFRADDGSWSTLPPYPLPIHHVQLAVVDGTLYAFGGYSGGALLPGTYVTGLGPAGWPRTDLAFMLPAGALVWQPLPNLPEARAAGAAVVVDGRILLLGGIGPGDDYLASTWWFDPATNGYTPGPELPVARDHLTATVAGGIVIVTTGRIFHDGAWDDLDDVDRLDLATMTWAKGAPAPVPGGGQMAGFIEGHLLLAGGEVAEGPPGVHAEMASYDLGNDTWSLVWPMTGGRHGASGGTVGGDFFIAGGATPDGRLSGLVEQFARHPSAGPLPKAPQP